MPFSPTDAQYVAVGAASAGFTNPMEPGKQYMLRSTVDCWVKVTTTGGAAAAATTQNIPVKAGVPLPLANPERSSTTNAYVKVIRDSVDGHASLIKYDPV